eukprot:m.95169 g.95169  ORF g.95169 m.95169 type:complete len:408 (-) comp15144_c0_seq2:66-1289(-)
MASDVPSAPEAEVDQSILSQRPGYEKQPSELVIVCADDSERQFLSKEQKRYRKAPQMVLVRLREAENQMRIIGPTYTHLSQSQQQAFTQEVKQQLKSLNQTVEALSRVDRPQATPKQKKIRDARNGALLQMIEAASLGMPLEVWKTRMGRHRSESTLEALRAVYNSKGGGWGGVRAFWSGTSAKMVESASKGAVLMFSKEFIKESCIGVGMTPTASGFIAGAGGGVCQVTVMGPCTYMVTTLVNGGPNVSITNHIAHTWKTHGIRGFYPGGVPIAFRQATNWASRQGFTDATREVFKRTLYPDNPATARLSVPQEALAGIIGGTLACWNHPFEVARIEAQTRAAMGEPKIGMLEIFRLVTKEHGAAGLFKGVIPRIGLGIWQTTFMVTGANLIREHLLQEPPKYGKH